MEKVSSHQKAVTTIVSKIERQLEGHTGPLLVALDGRSGVGKTTLSKKLADKLGAVLIDGDDFYSGGSNKQWSEMSPKDRAERCIDWRRMRTEALEPLVAGKKTVYHPFNWDTWYDLSDKIIKLQPARVIILDGAYSARPELTDLIDFSVLIQSQDKQRRERLKKRESGSFMQKWHKVWDEAEDYYFSHTMPPSKFDLVVQVD